MTYKETTQKQLDNLYFEYFDKIVQNEGTLKGLQSEVLSSPLLIDLDVSYSMNIKEGSKRVLFVGKETNGWGNELGNRLPFSTSFTKENYLEELKKAYRDLKYSSNFWRFIKDFVIKKVNKMNSEITFLYTNLSRHDEEYKDRHGAIRTEEYLKVIHDNNNEIFRKEVEILKPDYIFFLTGPDRDALLIETYPDAQFKNIEKWQIFENENSLFTEVYSSELNAKSYRMYHPQSYNRLKWKICNRFNLEDCDALEILSDELIELLCPSKNL